jgi:radical SAM superfamily enzyme with C-terminal helix-hairpin-helix motif
MKLRRLYKKEGNKMRKIAQDVKELFNKGMENFKIKSQTEILEIKSS